MIKIHSTSYNNALRCAFINAKKSIYITSYVAVLNRKKKNCPVNKLFIILLGKLRSGLDVRWIIDRPRHHKTNYHAAQYLIRRLKKNQVPFWIAPKQNTFHAKTITIDENLTFIGSHNLCKSSFSNKLEISVEIDDPKECKAMSMWFLGLCQDPSFDFYPPGTYWIPDIYP